MQLSLLSLWHHYNTFYFLNFVQVKEQSVEFICCWHKITYSNIFIVKRNWVRLHYFTISTSVSKASPSVLKWPVSYQINKMVRLRTKYKCDWSVMLVKSSNDAERALHAGGPTTASLINSNDVTNPACNKSSLLQILKNFHPQWFHREEMRTALMVLHY